MPSECSSSMKNLMKIGIAYNGFNDGQAHSHGGVSAGCDAIACSGIENVIKEELNMELLSMKVKNDEIFVNEEKNVDKNYDEEMKVLNCSIIGKILEKGYKTCHQLQHENNVDFMLNVGGDHSVAVCSITSSKMKYKNLKVIWVDAHGDINTPDTSPSGNYHGMVLAHLLNKFQKSMKSFSWMDEYFKNPIKNEDVAFIGLRDIDKGEVEIIREGNIYTKSMSSVDEEGIFNVMNNIISKLDPNDDAYFHLSFDIDAADPSIAPGTGTMSHGGLTYRESMRVVQILRRILNHRFVSMDIVEVDSLQDQEDQRWYHGSDPLITTSLKTVNFAAHLIKAALDQSCGMGTFF